MEWAMSTRFRADKDLVVESGFPPMYMDILGQRDGDMAKAGFDCTMPFNVPRTLESQVPHPPVFKGEPARFQTVEAALEASGPITFMQLMTALGSQDGREISLDEIQCSTDLCRFAHSRHQQCQLWQSIDRQLGDHRQSTHRISIVG